MKNDNNSLNVISHSNLLADKTKPPLGIIENGILPEQSLLLLTGKPKSRKTFFAMNLAIAISSGQSFAGFSIPKARKTLFLSAEGGYYSNKKRIDKMSGKFLDQGENKLFWAFDVRLNFLENDDILKISEEIKKHEIEVVVFDPFIRFHSANENSANEMGAVFKQLQKIMIDSGCSIILIHHTGKDPKAGARGSSVINGEYDSEIMIKKSTRDFEHSLSFDLRHAESPSNKLIYFDKNDYWFNDSDTTNNYLSLLPHDGIVKNDLVKLIVENIHCGKSKAYNKIIALVKENKIKDVDGKLYLVPSFN